MVYPTADGTPRFSFGNGIAAYLRQEGVDDQVVIIAMPDTFLDGATRADTNALDVARG